MGGANNGGAPTTKQKIRQNEPGTWNLEPGHHVTVPPIAFNQTQTLSSIIRQRLALDPMTD